MNSVMSTRNQQLQEVISPFLQYYGQYVEDRQRAGLEACDFAFGNPHELPLTAFGEALQKHAAPQHKDWYAYKMNEEESQQHVAESLRQRLGVDFQPEDVFMTNGATGALRVALTTLLDPGDEVIINIPPWFFYEGYIAASNGKTVKVKVRDDNFDLDVEAIGAAITPKTRAIIVNSPHNPTGKIYPAETLQALAAVLTQSSQRYGRPIYLISDEAYSRILFDGRSFISPTLFYPHSLLVYTYGKTLLTPGQRLGYLALPPTMPDRADMRQALFASQILNGFAFPNAIMQYALPDLEKLIIDLEVLQHKRDWLVRELGAMGYQVTIPEGTFYLLPRSPLSDDLAFTSLLATHHIFCLPGSVAEIPGYFRISLTANEDMIKRSLPGFHKAIQQAQQQP